MKNKWLIALFIFFLGVIFLSLMIIQQSQKAVSLSEKEISITQQAESSISSVYSPQAKLMPITRLPLVERGITIIKAPVIEPEEKSIRVLEIVDQAANTVSGLNAASSSSEVQDSPQAGITKIGKRPPPEVAQEMNSSGIVMY